MKIDLVMFVNNETQRNVILNLSINVAVYVPANSYYSLRDLGCVRIYLSDKAMKRMIKDVRAGKIDPSTNAEDIIKIYYPEELL